MISVRRTNGLPQASFRFHLTMDTLALLAMCFPLTGALRTFTSKNNVRAGRTEPHMAKATCFSAVLNGKTGYRRIRLKLRTAQICASAMPGTAGFHITGSPPDICLCLCSFRTSILILKDEQISINA